MYYSKFFQTITISIVEHIYSIRVAFFFFFNRKMHPLTLTSERERKKASELSILRFKYTQLRHPLPYQAENVQKKKEITKNIFLYF